jgi:hypothetical protein
MHVHALSSICPVQTSATLMALGAHVYLIALGAHVAEHHTSSTIIEFWGSWCTMYGNKGLFWKLVHACLHGYGLARVQHAK